MLLLRLPALLTQEAGRPPLGVAISLSATSIELPGNGETPGKVSHQASKEVYTHPDRASNARAIWQPKLAQASTLQVNTTHSHALPSLYATLTGTRYHI
jgi:hypothetical protein